MPETCVVFGATGNTGSRVADGLLAAGKRVRVVGRSRERLARFAARGAEACALDATDTAAVGRALDGATAAYVMVPPLDYSNPNCDLRMQDAVSESLVAAIRASGIRFVVNLSSLGADRVGMMEQVDSLRRHELRLRTIAGLNVVHLRPGLFMESLLDQARTVATAGFFAYTLDPAVRIPMIAAADIARAALDRLLALDFRGESSVELAGPCDVSDRGGGRDSRTRRGHGRASVSADPLRRAALVAAGCRRALRGDRHRDRHQSVSQRWPFHAFASARHRSRASDDP